MTDSYNYPVTDYYTGATVNRIQLRQDGPHYQITFSDVYFSTFGRHKTMLLSQYFDEISIIPQPIAAFPVHVPVGVPYLA
jgi:hypothetical protein